MSKAAVALRRGRPIAVFPEGVRSYNPKGPLQEFKVGFFQLAVAEGIPIVPIAMSGSENAWPRGDWKFGYANIYISCGDPIHPAGHTPESLMAATKGIMERMRDSHPDRKSSA